MEITLQDLRELGIFIFGSKADFKNKTVYKEYIVSETWKEKRKEALHFSDDRCQICYSCEDLEVHHRTYKRLGDEMLSDLTVLCDRCHNIFHGFIGENDGYY